MAKTTKAKASGDGFTIEVDAEDMGVPSEVSVAVTKVVNEEVMRLDPYEQRIKDFKEKYSGLTIAGVDDKDGIEAVTLAIRDMRTVRVNTGKEKVAAKAPFWNACKFLEEKADFIQTEISKIENPLKVRLDQINEEKEKIKAERKRLADEQLMMRQQTLTKLGAEYIGGNFVLGEISFDAATIREADISIFEEDILPLYQAHYDKVEADKAAAKKKADDEAAEIEAQRKKLADDQAALLKQQKELQDKLDDQKRKDEAERREKRQSVINFRNETCQALGLAYDFKSKSFSFEGIIIPIPEAADSGENDLSDADFTLLIENVKPKIAEAKRVAEEKKAADLQAEILKNQQLADGRARKSFLNSLQVDYGTIESLGEIDAAEWENLQKGYQETYNSQQAEKAEVERKRKEQEEKEKQELEMQNANDKTKRQLWLKPLHEMLLSVPTFGTAGYKKLSLADIQAIQNILYAKPEIKNQYSK